VKVRFHYTWHESSSEIVPMLTLYLSKNGSNITLSGEHFIYVNDEILNIPKVIREGT